MAPPSAPVLDSLVAVGDNMTITISNVAEGDTVIAYVYAYGLATSLITLPGWSRVGSGEITIPKPSGISYHGASLMVPFIAFAIARNPAGEYSLPSNGSHIFFSGETPVVSNVDRSADRASISADVAVAAASTAALAYSGAEGPVLEGVDGGGTITLSGLDTGKLYAMNALAVSALGQLSELISVNDPDPLPLTVLSSVTNNGSGSATVTIVCPSTKARIIYRLVGASTWSEKAVTPAAGVASGYEVTGLTNNRYYEFAAVTQDADLMAYSLPSKVVRRWVGDAADRWAAALVSIKAELESAAISGVEIYAIVSEADLANEERLARAVPDFDDLGVLIIASSRETETIGVGAYQDKIKTTFMVFKKRLNDEDDALRGQADPGVIQTTMRIMDVLRGNDLDGALDLIMDADFTPVEIDAPNEIWLRATFTWTAWLPEY